MGIKWTVSIRQIDLGVSKVFDKHNFFQKLPKTETPKFPLYFEQIPLYFKSAGSHRQMMINLSQNFWVHSVGHMSLKKKSQEGFEKVRGISPTLMWLWRNKVLIRLRYLHVCKVQDLAHLHTCKFQLLIKTLFLYHPLHAKCKVQDLAHLHTCKFQLLI